jgi:hypothetical protein
MRARSARAGSLPREQVCVRENRFASARTGSGEVSRGGDSPARTGLRPREQVCGRENTFAWGLRNIFGLGKIFTFLRENRYAGADLRLRENRYAGADLRLRENRYAGADLHLRENRFAGADLHSASTGLRGT